MLYCRLNLKLNFIYKLVYLSKIFIKMIMKTELLIQKEFNGFICDVFHVYL